MMRIISFFIVPRLTTAVLLWLIIGAGMMLRVFKADEFPIYQNDDGLFYSWAGSTTLTDPTHPTSLTIFDANNASLIWRSQYKDFEPVERFGFKISNLWFDHPFLSSIFVSLPAQLLGYTGLEQIPHMLVRLPALIASFFTLILAYLLARDLFGARAGMFTLLFLAFWPLHIFSSRQSYLEALMTPVWLLGLWCVWRLRTSSQKRLFLATIASAVFVSWSKITGYAAFLVYGFWLHHFSLHRKAWQLLGIGAITLVIYLTYGHLIGGGAFWETIAHQGGRGSYLSSFFYLVTHPDVQGVINDGWWLLALLSVGWLAGTKTKPGMFVVLTTLFWFSVVFLTSGKNNSSPWYLYPVYPLLAIAAGRFLMEWWKTPRLWMTVVFLLLGFTGWELARVPISSIYIRLTFMGVVGLFSLEYANLRYSAFHIVKRCVIGLLLVGAIMGNILAVLEYPKEVCKDGSCLRPTKIFMKLPQ